MIALSEHKTVTHWKLIDAGTLGLYWTEPDNAHIVHPFIVPIDHHEVLALEIKRWLDSDNAAYTNLSYRDGTAVKGFRVVSLDDYCFIKVKTCWIIYGK